ncbi:MAG TPA: polysaccharide biosynthesis/export family protein [Flavisolibacter sp.]|nr:polysaccharide biosynthesis/export family protein [Flavisolibacter sp.]
MYFKGQGDAALPSIPIPQTVITQNDLLSIIVTSLNQSASTVFNAPNVASPASAGNSSAGPIYTSGYLVDNDGNIQFPLLGSIKAAGLTEAMLKNQIVKALTDKKLLLDPIVTIRHLNFRVTVLGEVGGPTVINVPSEKISLLEALGLAGDVTIYGKRDNVLVIREEAGQKIIKRLNLNTSEIFNSPYYYLRSNDIVYVEPNKAKVASSSRGTQLLPIVLSGLSFAAIIIDRLTR